MAIPTSQLVTWSHQGATVGSSTTYQSIKNALTHDDSPIKEMVRNGWIKIYLQGSYAHDTNVRGDSDVDVMVELTSAFGSNSRDLPPQQSALHDAAYPNATYFYADLKRDVIIALQRYFGASNVDVSGSKSVKVLPNGSRLKADVVPVVTHRQYGHFLGDANHSKELGVAFFHSRTGQKIVNYPHHHYNNAVSKHQATGNSYKGLVRILKNARTHLVEHRLLGKEKAPSYFVQGLVYNVPNNLFSADTGDTVLAALRHFHRADVRQMISQNGIHLLVGPTGEFWNEADANETIAALVHLWDNWS